MTTELENLKGLFEALVPQRVKDLDPDNPDRVTYDDLSEYSEEKIGRLCKEWNLGDNPSSRLMRVWRKHPDRVEQTPQPPAGKSDFILCSQLPLTLLLLLSFSLFCLFRKLWYRIIT